MPMFSKKLVAASLNEKNQNGVRYKIFDLSVRLFDRFASEAEKESLKRAAWYEFDSEFFFNQLFTAFEEKNRALAQELIDMNHVRHHENIYYELIKKLPVETAKILLEFERIVQSGRSLHFLLDETRLFPVTPPSSEFQKEETSSLSLEDIQSELKKLRRGRKPKDPEKRAEKQSQIDFLEQQEAFLLNN